MKELIISASDFLNTATIERRVEKFEGDIGFPSNIAVWLKVTKISDDAVYISGAVEGYIEIECSRCLSVYRHPVEIDIETDMDLLSGETDMGEEIRQLIVLEIPSKPLCGPDCLGICPECGKHNKENDKCSCVQKQNEDFAKERWETLFNKK
ncbi:MAG: YceD family protein [Endomicrobia bacterium]|nr:YceD family protein [Endomicrobiia bacterium]MCL2506417.1 YceD family protein [Endomicrobiia bacterium]